ncbi:MAG TPA: helix-turn-helix transcriptional regulator [Candidatus Paceibacterota bacterium]
MENREALVDVLNKGRLAIRKTQSDIAKELGVKVSTVRHWEYRDNPALPPEGMLLLIAWVYRVGLDELTAAWEMARRAFARRKEARRTLRERRGPNRSYGIFGRPASRRADCRSFH